MRVTSLNMALAFTFAKFLPQKATASGRSSKPSPFWCMRDGISLEGDAQGLSRHMAGLRRTQGESARLVHLPEKLLELFEELD